MFRPILSLALFAAVSLSSTGVQAADKPVEYPVKPIRLIVGFPPGGGADNVARIVSDQLSQKLGQSIVVENRPGAGTTIAASSLVRAEPDGYTLFLGSSILFGVDKLLYGSVDYSISDFTPITRWTSAPMILSVNKDLPAKSVPELIAYAKTNPNGLFFGSSGNGGSPHLAGVMFQRLTNTQMEHVPFKGGAPSVQAVVANDIQLTFGTPPSVLPLIRADRLRALGVTTAERSPFFPEIPTIAEQGIASYDLSFWFGLFAPADVPKEIVDKLYQSSVEVLQNEEVQQKLAMEGNQAHWSASPEEFKDWVAQQGNLQKGLAQEAGVTID